MTRRLPRSSPWIDPRIDKVTVALARSYLTAHGWREEPFDGREPLVFRAPRDDDDGQEIEVVLPSKETFDVYPLRIEELVGTVAWLEDRPAADVITDMLAGPSANGPARPRSARVEKP